MPRDGPRFDCVRTHHGTGLTFVAQSGRITLR
jgi:hypothetical protein